MQEYKREKNTVEAQLKDMRKKARYHDDHLRVIDLWFKQLIDEVKSISPGVIHDSDGFQPTKHLESISRIAPGRSNHYYPDFLVEIKHFNLMC